MARRALFKWVIKAKFKQQAAIALQNYLQVSNIRGIWLNGIQ